MKYGIMRSGGTLPPWERDVVLYLAPVSIKAERFQLLTPSSLDKSREFTLMRQDFHFKTYEGCPDSAVEAAKEALAKEFSSRAEKYSSRMRGFFTTGTVAFVLGLINIFVPDPLPYLDEAFLLFGGAAVAALGWYALKRLVEPYKNSIHGIIENIRTADTSPDPVLTSVYRAIRTRAHPEEAEDAAADEIEQESAWLVKHLNLPAILQAEPDAKKDFFSVLRVLARSFRARQFLRRGGKKTRAYRRRVEQLGLDEDAAAVYEELFCRARDVFAEHGEKFP